MTASIILVINDMKLIHVDLVDKENILIFDEMVIYVNFLI